MNTDYLRTFLEVVRLKSFSEAAKRLGLSQPAVSFQIQRLERDLVVRLIDRSEKGFALTQAGERFRRFAESVVQERERLLADLDVLRSEVAGTLAIAASTIPGEYLVAPILGKFRSEHPAVNARLAVFDSIAVIEKVSQGEFDIGFCGTAPEGYSLSQFKVAADELVLVVPPQHPLAQRESVSLLELTEEPWLFREETSGTQRSLARLLNRQGFDLGRISPVMVLGSTQSVLSAVEGGVGIAFISDLAVAKSASLGLLKVVPVEALKLERDFYCVYNEERLVSRLQREFLAFVRGWAAGG
ncbi:MAG: LysR family transcriptional regulator [Chloroflexi bacterium]|nr:LysR family transcriptional regulator [Chloroflexota bacterium]